MLPITHTPWIEAPYQAHGAVRILTTKGRAMTTGVYNVHWARTLCNRYPWCTVRFIYFVSSSTVTLEGVYNHYAYFTDQKEDRESKQWSKTQIQEA